MLKPSCFCHFNVSPSLMNLVQLKLLVLPLWPINFVNLQFYSHIYKPIAGNTFNWLTFHVTFYPLFSIISFDILIISLVVRTLNSLFHLTSNAHSLPVLRKKKIIYIYIYIYISLSNLFYYFFSFSAIYMRFWWIKIGFFLCRFIHPTSCDDKGNTDKGNTMWQHIY